MPRSEFLEEFAKAFPETAAKVSSQAPIGRRYRLLHDGSKAHPEVGLAAVNARIAELEEELANLRDKRTTVEAAADESTPDVLETLKEATYRGVQQAAKDAGVSAKGAGTNC